jgi:serine/threonine protein kinase
MPTMNDARPLGIPGLTDHVVVGRGGFGVVYAATEQETGRRVAVKVLDSVTDHRQQARFEAECQAMSALAHLPFIVQIERWGRTTDDRPYLVMEYLPGGSLADRLRVGGPLVAQRVRILGDEIAAALAGAHRVGIVHRDVKPENVLLDADGHAKLTDFGIAVVTGMTAGTTTGTLVASFAHVAPELLDGARPSPLVDVYSLGSTLVTLLTGRPPFEVDGDSPSQMLARVLRGSLPDLRAHGVPEDLDGVLRRAMARDPQQRTYSAEQLAAELRGSAAPATAQGPMPVRAPLAVSPAAAAPRRNLHPRLVLSSVLGLLALVAATLGVLLLHSSGAPTPGPTTNASVVIPASTGRTSTSTTAPATNTAATTKPTSSQRTTPKATSAPRTPVSRTSTPTAASTDSACHIGVGTGCYSDNHRIRPNAGQVNIRSEPDRTSDIVATVNGGQTVKADCMGGGDTLEGGDGSSDMWVGVDLGNGFSGWIIGSVFDDTSTIQPCD